MGSGDAWTGSTGCWGEGPAIRGLRGQRPGQRHGLSNPRVQPPPHPGELPPAGVSPVPWEGASLSRCVRALDSGFLPSTPPAQRCFAVALLSVAPCPQNRTRFLWRIGRF